MSALALSVVAGHTPLVLVAPHGGRRDADAHPWGSRPLKMNDLHTASLTRELAERCGAAALVNEHLDRNVTDLNRVSAAHENAPAFLERLHDLVRAAESRHGFAVVMTVHGWNVVQPAVDIGLGCRPSEAGALGPSAAVSADFAGSAVAVLCRELAGRGIATTLGARYPAQARENLVQLFSGRHREDARPGIARFAPLGDVTEALQLELGAPLRWPGAWRRRFVDACAAALPAFVTRTPATGETLAGPCPRASDTTPSRRLEVVGRGYGVAGATSDEFALVAALDATGGRILVFPPDGTLLMFGGDRLDDGGPHADGDAVGSLVVSDGETATLHYRGPLLHFPNTTPFVDLEQGLASAAMVDDAELHVRVRSDVAPLPAAGRFGTVHGTLTLDGRCHVLDGRGFTARSDVAPPWPRLRTALRLHSGERLVLAVATAVGVADGTLLRNGSALAIRAASFRFDDPDRPLDRWYLDVALDDGSRREIALEAVHRLPVVRGGVERAVRVLYASCRIVGARVGDSVGGGTCAPAGWAELAGY